MADAEKIIDELFGPEPDLEEEPVGEEAAQPDEVVAPSDPDPSEAEPEAAPTPDVTGTDVTDQGEDPVTEGSSPEETGSESDSGSAELSGDESERERGLLRDLQKLRRANQELKASQNLAQPLPPVLPPAAPPPSETTAPPNTIPVQVDEKGEVYVDPNAVEGLVSSAAQAAVQAALTPTPEQQEQMRVNQEIEQIRQEYPDAMRKADAAEEFLAETLRSFVAQGYRFQSYEQIRNLMIERGVDQQLAQHIPELGGPMFVEFMDSLNSNNPTWRRSVASRMEAPPVANSALEGLPPAAPSMSPPALARRGGSRTGDVPQADRAEFEQLEVEFRKDITLMPQEKYDRMRELGAKLGVEGY